MIAEGRLDGRVVLVTGASRGLGAAVATACAAQGAKLVLAARTSGALEELDDACRRVGGGESTLAVLDLTKGELIDALGRSLFDRFGRLDGLVACAAELGTITPVSHLEPNTFERILAVNLVANQRLIRSVDPLLRAAPAGRAVFVTDGVGPGRAYWGGYAATKAALEAMVLAYAAELRLTQARVNLFDPGPMETRLRAHAFPGERPGAVPAASASVPALLDLLQPTCQRNGEIVRMRQSA